jgi:hypothetical protein
LSPILADEAGLDVYTPLASEPFALRVAGLLSEQERRKYGVLSSEEINQLLAQEPPGAIVTGYEAGLDDVLTAFAKERGYWQQPLSGGATVWVRPNSP